MLFKMVLHRLCYRNLIAGFNLPAFTLVLSVHIGTCDSIAPKLQGTKTTYINSFTDAEKAAIGGVSTSHLDHQDKAKHMLQFYPPYCKPVHLSMVLRHAIRSPSPKDINNILQVHQRMHHRHDAPSAHISKYLDWELLFPLQDAKNILEAGRKEMKSLAGRLKDRYSELLSSDSDVFSFVTSDTNRTIGSAEAFIEGLHLTHAKPELEIRNDLLRFFDSCSKYIMEVEDNKAAVHQSRLFKEGELYQDLLQRTGQKLGLKLTTGEMKSIYVMSAMEEAVMGSSVWTDLLDDRDLLLLQYAKDIKTYWKKGYGHEINYLQSCPLLADLFSHMDAALQENRQEKAAFWFGHAETLLPLMCILGLFKDPEPLNSDNFDSHQDRQFKTNRMLPFSTNVGFLLLECDPADAVHHPDGIDVPGWRSLYWPPNPTRYMVQLLVKELPHRFPFCQYDICSYEDVKEHYAQYLEKCDLNSLCTSGKHTEL